MRKQIEILNCINPSVKVGDKVILIDGSSLTSKDKYHEDIYIVYEYPDITGSQKILKELVFTVTKTNITNLASTSSLNSVYLQDIEIEFNGHLFYTCSKFVRILPLKLWNYENSSETIWATFDCGSVEAYDKESAKEKAIEIIKYNLQKANDVLNASDVTQGFFIEMNFDNIKIEFLNNI